MIAIIFADPGDKNTLASATRASPLAKKIDGDGDCDGRPRIPHPPSPISLQAPEAP